MSEKKCILIVDDDFMIRSLAQKILNRVGFDTALAESSEAAVALLEGQPGAFDLVITDYSLEVLSGVDLADRIRSLTPNLPIIMSSGEHIELDNIPLHLHHNMHILHKPYRSGELVALVETALAGAALERHPA